MPDHRPPPRRPAPPPGELPPLRYRWDRISAIAATIVLLVVWVQLRGAEASARPQRRPSARAVLTAAPSPTPSPVPRCAAGSRNLHENLAAGPGRTVALTFDDGPGPNTPAVLRILAEQRVTATFFVIGSQAQQRPELVKAEVQQGHSIGNHSWSHRTPSATTGWPASAARQEIDRTNTLLTSLTGRRPCLFRPPGGIVKGIAGATRSRGMTVTLWSADSQDWRFEKHDDTATATAEIVRAATAGLGQKHPIVLLHDGGGDRRATVAALPQVISAYRAAGYTFTAVV